MMTRQIHPENSKRTFVETAGGSHYYHPRTNTVYTRKAFARSPYRRDCIMVVAPVTKSK